jgi:general L-amino acid transport system permease protein
MTEGRFPQRISSFLLDTRTIAVILQILFVIAVVVAVGLVADSMLSELTRRNITPNFRFLSNTAGFQLADAGDYTPNDTYLDAFRVGVINTLKVVSAGLVLTTILGILVGIFLLSHNWLVRNISRVYVEILRNTPLLVQIFVWYYVIILPLPRIQESIQVPADGITIIPLRWLIFLIFIPLFLWFSRRLPEASLARMLVPIVGVLLIIAAESLKLFGMPLAQFEMEPIFFLSNRGIAIPGPHPTVHFDEWLAFVGLGVLVGSGIWLYFKRKTEGCGIRYPRVRYGLIGFIITVVIGWVIVSFLPLPETVTLEDGTTLTLQEAREQELLSPGETLTYSSGPIALDVPRRAGLRYADGIVLLPEYSAILLALVVYTSAFIAEIVRAGILAVPHGQVEAARALGLTYPEALRLIILPQALRVIIPPLSNQYLNLAKNSSLAIAISFTDVFQVTGTIINQTGQSVSGILMVMATYLVMSLVIALVMNIINSRFQLITRDARSSLLTRMRARFRRRAPLVTR